MRFLGKIALGPEIANTVGLYGVVSVPERNRLYCSNLHTPWLTIIDTKRRQFAGVVPLEEYELRGLMEIARHPGTGAIYIASELNNCLYMVNPATDRREAKIETGETPHYVDFDERSGRIFVSCGAENSVMVYSSDHRRLRSVPVGKDPWGIAVDSMRRALYVVCQGDATLWRLHLDRLEPIAEPARLGDKPRFVAVDPVNGRILVAHGRERRLFVFEAASGEAIASPETEYDSMGVTVDFRYRRIYVVNRMGKLEEEIGQPATVTVIDAEYLRTVRHVEVGKISHYMALDDAHLYVTNEDSLDVSVIDRERTEEITRINKLGQTVDQMAIHPDSGRIYIPSHLTDELIVVDPDARKVIARGPVGSWATSVGIDSRRGLSYVSNMDNGTVTVLRDSDYTKVDEIDLGVGTNKIHRLWSRVAVDERRRKIYVTLTRFNGLAVIDGATGRVERRVRLGEKNPDVQAAYVRAFELSVCLDEATGLVWVMNGHQEQLSVVDPETGKIVAAISLSNLDLPLKRHFSPFSVLAAHPSRKRVYAYNWIVSTETHRVVGSFPRRIGTGVTAVDEARDHLYVHGLPGLTVLDAEKFGQLAFLPMEAEPGRDPLELRCLYSVDLLRKRIYVVRHVMMHSNELEVYEADL